MGYWGAGNLDSDYAAEELWMRTGKMVRTMLARARKKKAREWDEYEHTALLVDFEILFALDAKKLLTGDLPDPEEIAKLQSSFLQDYDAYCGEDEREDYRKVLVRNFSRFKRICAKHAAA